MDVAAELVVQRVESGASLPPSHAGPGGPGGPMGLGGLGGLGGASQRWRSSRWRFDYFVSHVAKVLGGGLHGERGGGGRLLGS